MPIETHEYNTNHYLCFSCQSTVAFLEDSRFFETHKNKISFEMFTKDGSDEEGSDEEGSDDSEWRQLQ